MKILFVSSGNKGMSPVVYNQGESLRCQGVLVDYYLIKGKGVLGYLSNVRKLRALLHNKKYDVVHAHYSLSAFVATLANAHPLVVSLMGSDVKQRWGYRVLIRLFAFLFSWRKIIVKSEDMRNSLNMKRTMVIPNGVDLHRFRVLDRQTCCAKLGWNPAKKHVLFPANKKRPEKNFQLLEEAVEKLDDEVELHWFNNVANEETPYWYNAADVVVMASLWEGSPNAIKEAMACCRPVVSTDVGDVRWLFGNTDGCYITDYTSQDCASKIQSALTFHNRTNGRQRISELGLDSEMVAKKLEMIYMSHRH